MNAHYVVSVIIPTLNSAHNLPNVLDSIRNQQFPQKKIEIIVIDGGSTDRTIEIAKSRHCRIIHNPKVLPEWAKYLGYCAAKGRYAMFLDSDEVLLNTRSIKQRISTIQANPQVHAITGSGYVSPHGYSFLNRYISDFGDPFSYFYYRASSDSECYISTVLTQAIKISEDADMVVITFNQHSERPIFELAAMGGLVDLDFLRKQFPQIKEKPYLVWHMFNLLVTVGSHFAIVKNDPIEHYSVNSLKGYLGKISSRIKANIFAESKSGFSGRERYDSVLKQYKKYLFIPYALTIVLPLADSVYLAITRRQINYLIHLPLTLYTAGRILYFMSLKLIGVRPELTSYGETVKIG